MMRRGENKHCAKSSFVLYTKAFACLSSYQHPPPPPHHHCHQSVIITIIWFPIIIWWWNLPLPFPQMKSCLTSINWIFDFLQVKFEYISRSTFHISSHLWNYINTRQVYRIKVRTDTDPGKGWHFYFHTRREVPPEKCHQTGCHQKS